jgi:TetR/AcrR family transcriptional regulator
MNFECSREDSRRLLNLSAFGDLAGLLPGQDYIPQHIAAELRAHDALREVKGTMPLLRVETWCDEASACPCCAALRAAATSSPRMASRSRSCLRSIASSSLTLALSPCVFRSEPMSFTCSCSIARSDALAATAASDGASVPSRKRTKPGERRIQILQTLAGMLEQPGAERITTAALAARLQVSEAALYRHFASKAQMFEGLIEFIETSVFTLVNQIVEREPSGALQARKIAAVVLQFGEKNPGMTRVMVGDALVLEHERLTARMNQFFDRVESQLRQSLRLAAEAAGSPTPTVDAAALASAVVSLVAGRLQRYARSGFRRSPLEHLDVALVRLAG